MATLSSYFEAYLKGATVGFDFGFREGQALGEALGKRAAGAQVRPPAHVDLDRTPGGTKFTYSDEKNGDFRVEGPSGPFLLSRNDPFEVVVKFVTFTLDKAHEAGRSEGFKAGQEDAALRVKAPGVRSDQLLQLAHAVEHFSRLPI